jgi:hypothetical protein
MERMERLTAIELLANNLKENHGIDLTLYSEFDQAKQMEKEQITKAYNSAIPFKFGEQYYNETFKSE